MQEAALEAASRQDLILLSPTGSGKTLAFLLPLLPLLRPDVRGVQALVRRLPGSWPCRSRGFFAKGAPALR
ncbi:Lhr-like helicase [Cesiribacter andamanensis AMV16]|uniref:Lhr-like helicase n=2 Tax=Cesiribacter TaxID=1133570 RepID=M7MWU9_9BACT|nr:Lhr-like helicase [Cesiribacter andamanensis AMV16]